MPESGSYSFSQASAVYQCEMGFQAIDIIVCARDIIAGEIK
jgi:hypothetical protein